MSQGARGDGAANLDPIRSRSSRRVAPRAHVRAGGPLVSSRGPITFYPW